MGSFIFGSEPAWFCSREAGRVGPAFPWVEAIYLPDSVDLMKLATSDLNCLRMSSLT